MYTQTSGAGEREVGALYRGSHFSRNMASIASCSWLKQFLLSAFIMLFLLPGNPRYDARLSDGCQSGIFMVAGDDEAEMKLRAIFIADVKKLLTHNQVFYNTYGTKDSKVDLAFDEARIAADVIFLYPQIFHYKVESINTHIKAALSTKEEVQELMTADGVPVFVHNGLLILTTLGGIIRFPE